jgi:putative Holliday junction resolvase
MRFLGIDPGEKRIGLAVGDDIGIASPLPALTQAKLEDRWTALTALVKAQRITELVVGCPFNMDGTTGPAAKKAEAFAAELRTRFGLPVHLADERLTSHLAEQSIPKKKLRQIRSSGVVDSRAAAILLGDYLQQRFPPPLAEMPEAEP